MKDPQSISVTDNRYTIDGKEYPRLSVVTSQHVNVGLEEWRKVVWECMVGVSRKRRFRRYVECRSYGLWG